jgi:hypothetical protein
VEAASLWIEVLNANPQGASARAAAYNAAVAFDRAGRLGNAIHLREHLLHHYPASMEALLALPLLGEDYWRVTDYERAAEAFEDYVLRLPHDPVAADLLERAARIRFILGAQSKSILDADWFYDKYRASKPDVALDLVVEVTSLYYPTLNELNKQRLISNAIVLIRHLEIHRPEQAVIGHVRLGRILWSRACTLSEVDGLCFRSGNIVRPLNHPVCETPRQSSSHPTTNEKLASAAMKHFVAALRIYETLGADVDDTVIDAAAYAMVAQADGLSNQVDFAPFDGRISLAITPAEFQRRLEREIAGRLSKLHRAERAYAVVASLDRPIWSAAAFTRIAILSRSISDLILTTRLPEPRSRPKLRKAYCDVLIALAEPFERRVRETIDRCHDCLTQPAEMLTVAPSSTAQIFEGELDPAH